MAPLASSVVNPLWTFMRQNPDLFAVCESLHFIGLSVLVGALLVMDARALGYLKGVSYAATLRLTPVAVIGLILNIVSGVLMFSAHPDIYGTNPVFGWKMGFVLIAALNAGWFVLYGHRLLGNHPDDSTPPLVVRISAAASLASWFIVILLGRLMPTFANVGGG